MLNRQKTIKVDELASLTGSQLIGNGNLEITGVADLDTAADSDVSFFANPRYEKAMLASQAGAIFVAEKPNGQDESRTFLVSDEPSLAFQKAIEFFLESVPQHTGFTGIHPSAVVAEGVSLGEHVVIGPHAVIESGATIGNESVIGPGVTVGIDVEIGSNVVLHPNVVIQPRCRIGNRVVIHPGAVIGADGYGYTTGPDGVHTKLAQLGNVVIEEDVEIGANTTIDRARFKTTIVRAGTKIDNLVQLGHGVEIGRNNLIIAQVGIAGSSKTGTNVIIAGQSAVAGHLELTDGVIVAGQSGVIKSIKEPGIYGGSPADSADKQRRQFVHLRNLDKHVTLLKDLKKRVEQLESTSS